MGYLFHNLSNIWNTFQQGCQNWPVLLFVFKYWVKGHATCTVPTRPNLTPKRTQGSLWVSFESAFQKASALGLLRVCSESAQGPLGVRSASALGGPICALMREADSALLLPPTSPPLVYSKYTVQSDMVAIWSIHTCRTVMENINKITRILTYIRQRIVNLSKHVNSLKSEWLIYIFFVSLNFKIFEKRNI